MADAVASGSGVDIPVCRFRAASHAGRQESLPHRVYDKYVYGY